VDGSEEADAFGADGLPTYRIMGIYIYLNLNLESVHSSRTMTLYPANEHHRISFGNTQAVQDPEQNSNESRPRQDRE